ncbi:hypothetical protein [Psychroflexus salis]|uniref:Uncharacterized protein n=1 Tax=Psychroflexus salis TaxID=1526574 RepID=A0A917E4T3_9FLAO|nr:hypothetical protein [Psychroflexus salis]GGE04417.1 hypothetical protein GCM10010831_02470 [Psychroflexus salis]
METKNISLTQKISVILFFLLLGFSGFSQKEYQVNGESLLLYVEEEGELSLLTERSTRDYRYFLKKDDQLVELTKENYREKIDEYTASIDLNTRKLDFTRRDLSMIVLKYNYGGEDAMDSKSNVHVRLGLWGGQSNFIMFRSEDDNQIPFAGIEAELYSEEDYPRNSLLLQLRKSFPTDDFELDITEMMIGYRFKIIDTRIFHFYAEAELISFGSYDETFLELDNNDVPTEISESYTALNTPLGIGAGMAIRLFNETFLTLNYSNIYKFGEDTRDDFSVDLRAGVKFRL